MYIRTIDYNVHRDNHNEHHDNSKADDNNYHDGDKVVRCGLARPDEAHMLGTETSAEMYGR